jgi:hypothetical protein
VFINISISAEYPAFHAVSIVSLCAGTPLVEVRAAPRPRIIMQIERSTFIMTVSNLISRLPEKHVTASLFAGYRHDGIPPPRNFEAYLYRVGNISVQSFDTRSLQK